MPPRSTSAPASTREFAACDDFGGLKYSFMVTTRTWQSGFVLRQPIANELTMVVMNGTSKGETNPTVLVLVSLPASSPAAYSFTQYSAPDSLDVLGHFPAAP